MRAALLICKRRIVALAFGVKPMKIPFSILKCSLQMSVRGLKSGTIAPVSPSIEDDVAAFVFVADRARQSQIFFNRFAAVFFRDNVVNLMFRKTDFFIDQTIFAKTLSAFINRISQSS